MTATGASPGQLIVEAIERDPLGVEVHVPVDVHRHLDCAVSHDLHHHARMDPEREEQAHARVADRLLDRMAGRFARVETRRRVRKFVFGPLADLPRGFFRRRR